MKCRDLRKRVGLLLQHSFYGSFRATSDADEGELTNRESQNCVSDAKDVRKSGRRWYSCFEVFAYLAYLRRSV